MSLIVKDDSKKWIQSSVAVVCILLAYVLIKFFTQMSEWFELESKITFYGAISQVLSVVLSFGVFLYIVKNVKTRTFLEEVFQETMKVVWPNRSETVKHTIGIMIGVTIVGTLLAVFDLAATWLLSLIN